MSLRSSAGTITTLSGMGSRRRHDSEIKHGQRSPGPAKCAEGGIGSACWFLLGEVAQLGFFCPYVVGKTYTDRDAVIAGVEIDGLVLAEPRIAQRGQILPSPASHSVGRSNRLLKGGMAPGVRPVSRSTSSRLANRNLRQPRPRRTRLLARRQSAGTMNITKWPSPLQTSALAPLDNSVPRTSAASSLV